MIPCLRPADPTHAGALGEILHRFQAETEWMPELYSGAEAIAFCGAMIDRGWVTLAELDGTVAGFIARDRDEICALYVAPAARGHGIGRLLIEDAKRSADRLMLKTWQVNEGARRFYRRQGFVEIARGDGADNDENLPDVILVWPEEATT